MKQINTPTTPTGSYATPRAAACERTALDEALDAGWFAALGEPTRAGLFACLLKCGRPCAVGELASCCSVDLSVVSRHLKKLEQAGLIVAEKVGREVHYSVPRRAIADRFGMLAELIGSGLDGNACGCAEGGCGDG